MRFHWGFAIVISAGGVLAWTGVPRDPWPMWMHAYLGLCAMVGSALGHFWVGPTALSMLVAVLLTTCAYTLGIFLPDFLESNEAARWEQLMWLPLGAFFCALHATAATLAVFPLLANLIDSFRESRADG